jgi:hypothetical protein
LLILALAIHLRRVPLRIPLTIDDIRAPTLNTGTVVLGVGTLELSSVRAGRDVVAALVGIVANGDLDFGLFGCLVSDDACEKRGERKGS